MADINLEDLMAQKKSAASQSQAVVPVEPAKEIEKVTQQIETLSTAELAKVQSIKDGTPTQYKVSVTLLGMEG